MTGAAQLRALLAGDRIVMAPGAYDAWSARPIEAAGFPSVYMTGCGVSASVLAGRTSASPPFRRWLPPSEASAPAPPSPSSQTRTTAMAERGPDRVGI